jgi:ferrous iron transport protein B
MHDHSHHSTLVTPGGAVALVGHPNVGKSVIFQRLTGQHVTISNYPGTTVEIMRGAIRQQPDVALIDTPGVVTFPPHSSDEEVTERVLLNEPLRAILQVGDAKNLRRTLLLSLQLAEMGIPLVLALNMMDEARQRGVVLDTQALSKELGFQVIPTTAVRGQGVAELLSALRSAQVEAITLEYPPEIEAALSGALATIATSLQEQPPISLRAMGLLWLSGDAVAEEWLRSQMDQAAFETLSAHKNQLEKLSAEPLAFRIQAVRLQRAESLLGNALVQPGSRAIGFGAKLSRLTTHPVWGLSILAGVLYALYWFVGVFGAGTLVGLIEENLFNAWINPWVIATVTRLSPFGWLADLLVGQYGLWTMGITYAFALILPIVTTFFLAFSIMEDSGYLPRLAALSNRLFEKLGLNGKAVLPMVLGLGCVTMATLTTRVMESRRERLLVTLLLALAVPCSAQLGVVMGMLAGISLSAMLIWSSVIVLVMLAVGWLAARLVPGERTRLLVELPPLRWPVASNVLLKTLVRLEWYIKEVVPLFLAGAALMFFLDQTGILDRLVALGRPLVVTWLGLPAEASAAFLMGFLRRDFGATGLFHMQAHGLLTPVQVVVAMVTVTLFIPCIASVMMIGKERGWKTAAGMFAIVMPLAFLVGGLLLRLLLWTGWGS